MTYNLKIIFAKEDRFGEEECMVTTWAFDVLNWIFWDDLDVFFVRIESYEVK